MKFAFYVSGRAVAFKRFVRHLKRTGIEVDEWVQLVWCDFERDDELSVLLEDRIPLSFYSGCRKGKDVSDALLASLIEHEIDYLFCLGNKILQGELLNHYENRIINTHPSLLPSFKGLKAIDQALESRAFLLGVTIHFVDEGVDTGMPLMQILIHHSELERDYYRLLDLCFQAWPQIMRWLMEDRLVINEGYVSIRDANYTIDTYVPNLE